MREAAKDMELPEALEVTGAEFKDMWTLSDVDALWVL